MKSLRLTLSFTLFFLASFTAYGETQCPGDVTPVQSHSLPHSHIGVSVTINSSGPYEFMVDTGAQITVIDPALARGLELETSGSLNIVTVASHVEVPLVYAEEMTIGSVSVKGLKLAVEDLGPIQSEYPRLRGILGNNFLSRFDLLMDNSHRTLCFDQSRQMQRSMRGERLPIVGVAVPSPDTSSASAILVTVHLPDDSKQGSVLRLDSGSNVPLLYVDRRARALLWPVNTPVQGSTIGRQAQFVYAITPERNVRFGSQKEMQIAFATPVGNGRLYSKTGEDGVLPTTLFKRVFISGIDHFVIFDPR